MALRARYETTLRYARTTLDRLLISGILGGPTWLLKLACLQVRVVLRLSDD